MAWLNRFGWLMGPKSMKANIVIVGLPHGGKSTLMTQMKPKEIDMIHLAPTIPLDFHAEKFTYKSLTFVAFDLEDMNGFGNPWEDFYRDCHGIIFVVDSSDRMNITAVKSQIDKLLSNPLVIDKNTPMLFLANKMDQPGAVSSFQLAEMLELRRSISCKPWEVCSCDGLTGEGLNEALDWLALKLKSYKKEQK